MQDSAVAIVQAAPAAQIKETFCRGAQIVRGHAALHGSRTVAVAIATMPSPRPVKPSFSLVVALTATRVYGNAGDRRNARAHGVAVRSNARRLAHNGHVEMRDHAGARAHALAGEGEKALGRGAAPLRIARRKVRADVAVGKRAEDGVDERVQRDVGVGMSGEPARMRDAHAAEHDVIAVGEGVNVETVSRAHVGKRGRAQDFSANKIVLGGQLHVGGLSGEHVDAMAGPFGERGVIGKILKAPPRPRAGGRRR